MQSAIARRRLRLVRLLVLPVLAGAACTSKSPGAVSSTPPGGGLAFGPACTSIPPSGPGSLDGMKLAPAATAASNNPLLTTLFANLTKAGLADTLNNSTGITVFAPSNDAFGALPTATATALQADPAGQLAALLKYHVVKGRLSPDRLTGRHATLQGASVNITGTGAQLTVNGMASVVCGNISTANATVYIVDHVLEPYTANFGPACSTVPASGAGSFTAMAQAPVATAASNNPGLSTLSGVVAKAGLTNTLNNSRALTVFAPTNAAFAKLPAATMSTLLANPTGELASILKYHVVAGKLAPDQLDGAHTTLEGASLTVTGGALTGFQVDGMSLISCGNVATYNAVVYMVDTVLTPPTGTPSPSGH